MKKLLFIAMTMLFMPFCRAQDIKPGSLDFLKKYESLKIVVDYSTAVIDNMDYATRREVDTDWIKNEKEVTSRFITSFSKVLSSRDIKVSNNSDLLFVLKVTKIDDDGECYGFAEFHDKEGNVLASIIGLNGNGGKIGSLTNLAGDGMERLAKDIGNILSKYDRQTKFAEKYPDKQIKDKSFWEAKEKAKEEKKKAKDLERVERRVEREKRWRENSEKYKRD